MNYLQHLIDNQGIFFNYMKSKYPVVEKSNIFLRDLQFAIKSYFKIKGYEITSAQAEILAVDFTTNLEESGELTLVSRKTWKVNFSTDTNVLMTNNSKAN